MGLSVRALELLAALLLSEGEVAEAEGRAAQAKLTSTAIGWAVSLTRVSRWIGVAERK